MRVPARSLTALIALVLCAACSDATGPELSPVGVYHLRTINGAPLPYTIAQLGTDRVEVASGVITLNADGTFSERTSFRITEAGGSWMEEQGTSGTYTTNGSVVQLSPTGSARYSVALSDNRTLTQTVESFVLVYRK